MIGTAEYDYTVGAGESDGAQICKISAFLNFFQDAADRHAQIMGFHRDILMERYGYFWLLVRARLDLKTPARYQDVLTVRTNPRPVKGAMVYRDFDLFVGREHIGEAVTGWALASFEKRAIIRPATVPELLNAEYLPADQLKDSRLTKLSVEQDMPLLEHARVRYSDLDMNGHLNNIKYADMVCNAADMGNRTEKFVSTFQIDYIKECRLGEELALYGDLRENGGMVLGVDHEGNKRFASELVFTDLLSCGG